jgi:hypothetical protein
MSCSLLAGLVLAFISYARQFNAGLLLNAGCRTHSQTYTTVSILLPSIIETPKECTSIIDRIASRTIMLSALGNAHNLPQPKARLPFAPDSDHYYAACGAALHQLHILHVVLPNRTLVTINPATFSSARPITPQRQHEQATRHAELLARLQTA